MAEHCLHQLLFLVQSLMVILGTFWYNGLAEDLLKLHGKHWSPSRSATQIFSLRTSCFPRRAEVLWTSSLVPSSGAGPRTRVLVRFRYLFRFLSRLIVSFRDRLAKLGRFVSFGLL
ncbi:hypothetical protein PVAP13_7NG025185 [Panicum virgatum]|uniref:Uncharacterized protein n=1 Tax=Panicum virgatum TaxID=38727 RepID=A0A8T0Q214_PANVG|nr:hypothetical protein PVAP13_7NG025185 [Panicum virgatum]